MKISKKHFAVLFIAAYFCVAILSCTSAKTPDYPPRPRLMVMIVLDQFRADYLTRYKDRFLPARASGGEVGGFRYLMENGAYYPLAHHEVLQAMTGPGHAILGTGAYGYRNGIPLNGWYDSKTGEDVYCAAGDHPELQPDGGTGGHGVSPKNLIGATLGDALKNAGLPSKVVAVALKDRASVFLAGRRADAAYWFDAGNFAWTTSTWYRKDAVLPAFLNAHNEAIRKKIGESYVWKSEGEASPITDDGVGFTHEIKIGDKQSLVTPYGATLVSDLAAKALDAYEMGRGEWSDLLLVSFSGHDYAGHKFGPNSREMEELTLAEDKIVSELLNKIDKTIPGGLAKALVVLTADHGISPAPEYLGKHKVDASLISSDELIKYVNEKIDAEYNEYIAPPQNIKWLLGESSFNFYLDRKVIAEVGLQVDEVAEAAAKSLLARKDFLYAFTAADVRQRSLPPGKFEKQILNSYFPGRSGDVVAIPRPFYMSDYAKTTHMTGYNYDTTVPIIFCGPGVKKGVRAEPAQSVDIVSTMAFLAGVVPPSGAEGRVLHEMLESSQ